MPNQTKIPDKIEPALLQKAPLPTWEELEKKRKKRNFKLQSFESRETFLLSYPTAKDASKNFATIAGLLFAGSLTFLGLKESILNTADLKAAWIFLALSIFMHLLVGIAALDSFMSHGRAETATGRAKVRSREQHNDAFIESLIEGLKGHWNQKDFFRSIRYLISSLIIQFISLVIAGIYLSIFILNNV